MSANAHIVVVDDDEDVRSTVAEYLRRNGLSVSEADGGTAVAPPAAFADWLGRLRSSRGNADESSPR